MARNQEPFSHFIVGSLPMTEDFIPPDTVGRTVASLFEDDPKLPGLLIVEGDRLRGMVSRDGFNQRLARKYGIEIAYSRPILGLFGGVFDLQQTPLLVVDESLTVKEVAELCLHRDQQFIYEPIIVYRPGRSYGLINFHDLLISQTRLLSETYREARQQKELADEASRIKSQFLANVSHELRTPLTAILGYTEIVIEDLDGKDPSAGTISRLTNIHKAGDHLLSIIGSLLDISKIESGRVELFVETVSLRTLIGEVAETIKPLAASNENKLEVFMDEEPGEMSTDVTKLRQNLFNMLSNAAKFTNKGTIRLNVHRTRFQSRDMIQFRVCDTGIGMTKEQMARIFDPFIQADASTTRNYGGTGLGLTVTQNYCHLMGGDITVDSTAGVGTTFTMVLPAALPTTQSTGKA
jgi:signal transduction histidine kinase